MLIIQEKMTLLRPVLCHKACIIRSLDFCMAKHYDAILDTGCVLSSFFDIVLGQIHLLNEKFHEMTKKQAGYFKVKYDSMMDFDQ